MRSRRPNPAVTLVAATLFASACGAPAAERPPGSSATGAGTDTTDEGSESGAPAAAKAPPPPPRPACADSGCIRCGEGFCPSGFYCDESLAGGPACSWLAACTGKSTCACLQRKLSKCRCEEDGAGARVRCD